MVLSQNDYFFGSFDRSIAGAPSVRAGEWAKGEGKGAAAPLDGGDAAGGRRGTVDGKHTCAAFF